MKLLWSRHTKLTQTEKHGSQKAYSTQQILRLQWKRMIRKQMQSALKPQKFVVARKWHLRARSIGIPYALAHSLWTGLPIRMLLRKLVRNQKNR